MEISIDCDSSENKIYVNYSSDCSKTEVFLSAVKVFKPVQCSRKDSGRLTQTLRDR